MKCIHCGKDTTYPQRSSNGKRCATCQHPFAFEPRNNLLKVSDPLFQKCIETVSQKGTLQFTSRQLYYEFSRRFYKNTMQKVSPAYGWAAAGLGGGGIIGAIFGFPILLPVGIVGAIVAYIMGASAAGVPEWRVPRMSLDDFHSVYLNPWARTHGDSGSIPGLLSPLSPLLVSSSDATAAEEEEPPDLTAYSFDRALIVDRAEVAAMLVANRFHFENNCAILSSDKRFPASGRFEQILGMLHRNPRLIVFALHNASVEGMESVSLLREEGWFPNPTVRIADIGLRPRHAGKTFLLLNEETAQTLSAPVRAGLQDDEVSFLEKGFIAELEAMRPAKLMRAIYQAFGQMVTVGSDGGMILVDTAPGIWVGEGYGEGSGIYAADSFG